MERLRGVSESKGRQTGNWAGEMSQQEKAPATKPEDSSSVPSTHTVAGENQFLHGVLGPQPTNCGMCTQHRTKSLMLAFTIHSLKTMCFFNQLGILR